MKDFPLHDFYKDICTSYDRVNRIFTFGRDRAWRRKAASELLSNNPRRVLDLCTGTGDFVLELAARSADAGLYIALSGYDFSREMLQEAGRKAEEQQKKRGLPEITFMEGNAGEMPYAEGHFDALGITFGLRNLVYENSNAKRHLSEMHRVLRPGGQLVVLESSKPANSLWGVFNSIYLRYFLPYLGGLFSGNLKAYKYLASSSKNYYTIAEMELILERAGFKALRHRALFLGSVMLLVLEKK